MHNQNEFNLHVNEVSFSYERMSTKTRFEKEAKANSEMAYCTVGLTNCTRVKGTAWQRLYTASQFSWSWFSLQLG